MPLDIWSVFGKGMWRIRSSTELDHLMNGTGVIRFNKAQRIKWLGHIERRMDTCWIAKRLAEWKPMGS
jgi:hypothetical protein